MAIDIRVSTPADIAAAVPEVGQAMREHLHPLDLALWMRVIPVAWQMSRDWRLPMRAVLPESRMHRYGHAGCTGLCHNDGTIRLVLRHRDRKTDQWMGPRPEAHVWLTLAHELAHLEQWEHGPRHTALLERLLQDINDIRFR